MQRRMPHWVGVAVSLGWTSLGALALTASGYAAPSDQANLNYDIDAALTYIDAARQPDSGTSFIRLPAGDHGAGLLAPPAAVTPNPPRTLGLRRLGLGLTWEASRSASLHVVLRPDAVNRHDEAGGTQIPVREVDTRAGDGGLQPEPTLRLLDEYQITIAPGPGLRLGLGVWAGLQPTEEAYPELLGFGLKVLFPAKFSGLRLEFQPLSQAPDTVSAAGAKKATVVTQIYVFQGNEDRGEALTPKHDTFDVAPSAQDAYYGTALNLAYNVGADLSLGLLLGYLDQADPQGRFDEVFGQASAVDLFQVMGRQLKVSLEGRYLRSRGHGQVEPQTLQSGSLSGALAVVSDLWVLAGVEYGKGDRWTSDNQRTTSRALHGYDLELGALGAVTPELSLQLMLSHEYRKIHDGSGTRGGFEDATGNRPVINRMGLELTYKLNKNA